MIERSIAQLAKMMKIENNIDRFCDQKVKGVCIDTRNIEEGNLFVPFKGETTDGHRFVETAFNHGAGAVLWQKDVPNPPEDVPVLVVEDTLLALQELARSYRDEIQAKVIGITGSNGKTTTKDIAGAVFSEEYAVHKTDGNFNNHIGLPLTILGISETTEIAILEMGMSGKGEISLLSKIARPDAAIITNIGESHLQDLGSREEIAKAKLEIVDGLSERGLLIYPGNEPLLVKRVSCLKHLRTRTFGETNENDLYATQIVMDEKGSTFTVPNLSYDSFHLPILGKHNVMNALAVLLLAKEFSIPESSMKSGLKSVKLSNMRMEWHEGLKETSILNDAYNASPTSMRAVTSMIANLDNSRGKILVLGDMLELGSKEIAFHEQIGEELDPNKIKFVFTYGTLGKHIAEGAKKNFSFERIFHFIDKEQLIQTLITKIDGKEIILFKASRGMKMEDMIESLVEKVNE